VTSRKLLGMRGAPLVGLACLALAVAVEACARRNVSSDRGAPGKGEVGGGGVAAAGPRPDDGAPQVGGPVAPSDAEAREAAAAGALGDQAATVTLLEPGQPPRRKLRYLWRAGQKEELTMDLRTFASTETSGAQTPGTALPAVRIVIAIDAVDVSAEGDLHYVWRVTAADVLADARASDQVTDGMRKEVAVVAHLTGDGATGPTGIARRVSIDPGSFAAGAGTAEMVVQIDQTLRSTPAPFPDEAVGLGARWQRVCQVGSSDAHITQTDTLTLVSSAGRRGTLDDVLAQTAQPQELRTAAMRAGDQARLESMLVSGSATTQFDLARLVPRTHIDSTTTMVVSGRAAGVVSERTTMILRENVALAGKVR
jgi:hypothetical protein